ncbi:hypothetical protein AWB99_07170 [Mycolicibacterium confluentis]|nr:hypothetical protein AWB99_07170 [Mycolicibacterium confluentis]
MVLVAESGFTEQARRLALAEGMIPITPQTLDHSDPTRQVLNSMRSLWPKTVSLTPIRAEVGVAVPGAGIEWFQAPANLHVYAEDRSHIELLPMVKALLDANMERTFDQIDLQNIAEDIDAYAVITVGPNWTVKFQDAQHSLYVERRVDEQSPELLRIDGVKITAKAVIRVSEIQMHPRRLADIDVDYAFGQGLVGDREALIVVTEAENGGKLSIQFGPNPNVDARVRVNFDHSSCYQRGLHEKSKRGRDWCRKNGPASETT